jgi:hypothetical protein
MAKTVVPISNIMQPVDPEPFINMVRAMCARGAVAMAIVAYRPVEYPETDIETDSCPPWRPLREWLLEAGGILVKKADEDDKD